MRCTWKRSNKCVSSMYKEESKLRRWGQEQDDGGIGGCGEYLSPRIHQEYTFRHRSPCRTPAESRQAKCLASMHTGSLWSCLTLSNPVDCGLPGFSVRGVLQARILEHIGQCWWPPLIHFCHFQPMLHIVSGVGNSPPKIFIALSFHISYSDGWIQIDHSYKITLEKIHR